MRSRATSGECTRAPQRPNDRSTFKTRSQSHDGSEPPLRGSPTSSLSHDVTEFSAPTRGKEVATSTEKKSGDAKMADSIWPNGLALSLATTPLPAETVSTTAPLTALTQGHWGLAGRPGESGQPGAGYRASDRHRVELEHHQVAVRVVGNRHRDRDRRHGRSPWRPRGCQQN